MEKEKTAQDAIGSEIQQPDFYLDCGDTSILPWEKEGTLYWFLPSYLDWDQVKIRISTGELFLDGEKIEDGRLLKGLEHQKTAAYRFAGNGSSRSGEMQFLQSENIGTVFIETESGSMELIENNKEYREPGIILVKDPEGSNSYFGKLDSIKGRGNGTWKAPKNSYGIQLADSAALLGMEREKDWVLLCNVFDKTKIKNKLCYEMAEAIGLPYSVDSEWVDLYLNGNYYGNYLLCGKVEAGANRVDIQDGYLIEKDIFEDMAQGFTTEDGNLFYLKEPKESEAEQISEIADAVQKVEDLILAVFREEILSLYKGVVKPYALELLDKTIDSYVETVKTSAEMDMIRWDGLLWSTGYYESYDNNIRYMKYFLGRRLEFLDKEWLNEKNSYGQEGTGEMHKVTFVGNDRTESFEAVDGECVVATPEYLLEEGEWWFSSQTDEPFLAHLPLYEDVTYTSESGR